LVATDSTLYVGGLFLSIGGASRSCLAAVDAHSGVVKDWNPGANGHVFGLAATPSKLYVAGTFGIVGGWAQSGMAAVDLADLPAPRPSLSLFLGPVAPNPLHDAGTIRFVLPRDGPVNLTIYVLPGPLMATPLN